VVRTTLVFVSHRACVVCHSRAATRRRPLLSAVRWKTHFRDLVCSEVAVVDPSRGQASVLSTASAVPEVCCHCYRNILKLDKTSKANDFKM